MRLGAVCAEELKRRARQRAQCAPRTRHAFTEQEWRIHHPQQTRFGITRARNKQRFCFSARSGCARELPAILHCAVDPRESTARCRICLLYTSDAADE